MRNHIVSEKKYHKALIAFKVDFIMVALMKYTFNVCEVSRRLSLDKKTIYKHAGKNKKEMLIKAKELKYF